MPDNIFHLLCQKDGCALEASRLLGASFVTAFGEVVYTVLAPHSVASIFTCNGTGTLPVPATRCPATRQELATKPLPFCRNKAVWSQAPVILSDLLRHLLFCSTPHKSAASSATGLRYGHRSTCLIRSSLPCLSQELPKEPPCSGRKQAISSEAPVVLVTE